MKLNISRIIPNWGSGSMKIGTKIFALVAFLMVLLALVSGISIWQMNKIGTEIVGIADRDLPLTEGVTQITVHQLEQAINFERAMRTGMEMNAHPAAREEFKKSVLKFEELSTKVEQEFEEVGALAQHAFDTATTEEGQHEFKRVLTMFDKLSTEHKDYDKKAIEAFKLIHAGNLNQAIAMIPQIEAEEEDLDHELEKLLGELAAFTARAAEKAEAHERFALQLMLAITGMAFVIGTGTAIFLVQRSISRPLLEIVEGLDALNADDLSI
ncbi:MAG: MCP four helix bundle domain-containing protein, partial [Fimbriimonadaceae bacterium]|nr:MCP four helix bundle domain-containing protein [Alphaproteobacteria bacterium]